MKREKTKCFTLMELLVVISLVALLLAILTPGLRKAKEMAGRMVCANNERQLLVANDIYANSWDERYCPPMMEDSRKPAPKKDEEDERKMNWLTNKDFRKYMGIDDKQVSKSNMILPDEYFCPEDKVARYDRWSEYSVLVSYAYNVAEWYYPTDVINCYWDKDPVKCCKNAGTETWQIGHKRTAVKRAAEKINFAESVDWWATWQKGANYEIGWDILGQVPAHPPWQPNYKDNADVYGPVIYRHNEGANFAFYDGHVEYLPKEKVYIEEEGVSPLKDATGMWYVSQP